MRNYERRDHSRGPIEGVFTAAEKRRKRQQELQADAEREYNLDQERKRRAAYKAEYDKAAVPGAVPRRTTRTRRTSFAESSTEETNRAKSARVFTGAFAYYLPRRVFTDG